MPPENDALKGPQCERLSRLGNLVFLGHAIQVDSFGNRYANVANDRAGDENLLMLIRSVGTRAPPNDIPACICRLSTEGPLFVTEDTNGARPPVR
jgi:hypothetical protein